MEQMQPTGEVRNPQVRPDMVTAIGVMTLVNGILNILAGLGLTMGVIFGTIGLGILCSPITLLPAVRGVFEILYASKIMANPPQPVQFSQTIAILEICCILYANVISLVVGILALVFYNDQSVKDFFYSINQPATVSGETQ
jgi:hypothetical protein